MWSILMFLFILYCLFEILGLPKIKYYIAAFIACAFICFIGFVLASGLNFMFQGNEWFAELKAFKYTSYVNEGLNGSESRSFGSMLFSIPIDLMKDIFYLYYLYAFKFSTFITWVVNIFCWLICLNTINFFKPAQTN